MLHFTVCRLARLNTWNCRKIWYVWIKMDPKSTVKFKVWSRPAWSDNLNLSFEETCLSMCRCWMNDYFQISFSDCIIKYSMSITIDHNTCICDLIYSWLLNNYVFRWSLTINLLNWFDFIFFQDVLPIRLKGVIFINSPRTIHMCLKLMKLFTKRKIFQRVSKYFCIDLFQTLFN